MSDHDDRQLEEVPAFGASVRLSASIEPEAAAMLEALCARLYPTKRASRARAEVLEIAIRMLYGRVLGEE